MKKMMMFLIVSVFFLMGGMTDGMAQKSESKGAEKLSNSTGYVHVTPGATAWLSFQLSPEHSNWQVIGLVLQRPGSALRCIVVLYRSGNVLYVAPVDSRFSISFDASNNKVTVRLDGVKPSDEGIYYFVVQDGNGTYYWSEGELLTVASFGVNREN